MKDKQERLPTELEGWRETMREIDYQVKTSEDAAREFNNPMNRGMRDAWMKAQDTIGKTLTRMMEKEHGR